MSNPKDTVGSSLNTPLLFSQRSGVVRLVEDWMTQRHVVAFIPGPTGSFVNVITALDDLGLLDRTSVREKLCDGQPG